MTTASKCGGYVIYVMALIVLFLYLCFPSESVQRYAQHMISRSVPGITADIENIRPGFPPSLTAENIRIGFKDFRPVLMERLSFSPGYMELLKAGRAAKISGLAAGGNIKGSLQINRDSEKDRDIALELDFTGLRLEEFDSLINELAGFSAEAGLSGNLQYKGSVDMKGTGKASLESEEGRVLLNPPFYGVEELEFSKAAAEMDIENSRVTVTEFSFDGQRFSASGSGRVMLSAPLEKSRLNISARVSPGPELFEAMGGALANRFSRGEKIDVRISGTIGSPALTVR